MQFSDFNSGECANLYLGTIFGNPENICVCGQFVAGRISLDKKIPFDFINLKWDTLVFKSNRLRSTNAHYPPNCDLRSEECLAVAILTSELLPIIQTP